MQNIGPSPLTASCPYPLAKLLATRRGLLLCLLHRDFASKEGPYARPFIKTMAQKGTNVSSRPALHRYVVKGKALPNAKLAIPTGCIQVRGCHRPHSLAFGFWGA